jgi:hypothetical protein
MAVVWKLWPQFPANLSLAVGLNLLLGAALVAGWHTLLRDLGAGSWESLAIATISGLHPFVLSLSAAVLSDVPFMALAAWSTVLAGRSLWPAAAGASILAVLTRSVGVAVLGAVGIAAALRRAYRQAAVYLVLTLPFLLGSLWWSASRQFYPEGPPGYNQTILFYTAYWDFWNLSVPDSGAFQAMLAGNLWEAVQAPAALCFPLQLLPANPRLQGLILLMFTGAILAGVFWFGRREWHPFHFLLLLHVPVVALWNYPLANRFLLPFVPLFFLGALRAAQRALTVKPRAAAFALGAGMLVLAADAGYSYFLALPEQMAGSTAYRRALAPEREEAYAWIRSHTSPEDRFIAYEDANLYLHTGRQALRPLAFSSEANYRNAKAVLNRDLEHLTDAARQIQARYWLAAEDDYQLEAGGATIRRATRGVLQKFPRVFRSAGGRVEIYEAKLPER